MAKKGHDIRRYYANLYVWTLLNKPFRMFSGIDANTIHRFLTDPQSGNFSPATIHTLIEPFVSPIKEIDALDAGCGYGGTCLDLHQKLGGHWHGITISSRQTKVARRNAAAVYADGHVTFETASYDDPLDKRFNLIFGIESLIHAPEPAATIANLASALEKDGLFLIVDDIPVDPFPPEFAAELANFKCCWRCPEMPSQKAWSDYLNRAGCIVEAVQDFTDLMRPRAQVDLDNAAADITRRSWWRSYAGLQSVTDAELGGLVLERLGREGLVRYQMIVARKT